MFSLTCYCGSYAVKLPDAIDSDWWLELFCLVATLRTLCKLLDWLLDLVCLMVELTVNLHDSMVDLPSRTGILDWLETPSLCVDAVLMLGRDLGRGRGRGRARAR